MMEKLYNANSKRDLKWAVPMPDRIDFKAKLVTRSKKSTFKMIKGSIHEDMVIINILYLVIEFQSI